nr:hypothetical protein [Tanacetum cinerariifolium]
MEATKKTVDGRMYVSGHEDIFDVVDVDLFSVIALNMMVVKLETKLDGETSFADVARTGVSSSGLSHDESFGVVDLDLNLNESINLNVSQIETQSELHVSEEPDVGRTKEPLVAKVRTQETLMEEVRTKEHTMEDVVLEDYMSFGEDV